MLKFAKHLLLIIGAILILAAAIYLLYEFWLSGDSLKAIVRSSVSYGSEGASYDATLTGVVIGAVIGIVGGIVLGLGIGIPSATFKQRYEQRQAEAAKKLGEAAAKDVPADNAPVAS